ncbi:ATP-dependent DNA helicase [Hydrogenophaga palleronii]|uniref:ATP-dependent DNA helicase n=1 Tax=Hydrogenophaga palleronii TaxID=65655 RepID=UPI000A8A283B|nr:ATP-dependent DNA helicase [Hydrogenophaga palleronii]
MNPCAPTTRPDGLPDAPPDDEAHALSELQASVAAAFGADGALARAFGALHARPGQQRMAGAVASAIEAGDCLAVEAGTGVGKTFAYLVPLLLSGRRALLSTATQALQDQLHGRDIPAVARALGMPVRAALLKGRSSYVCLHRTEQALHGPASVGLRDPAITATLAQVLRWASASHSGDLAELQQLDERSPLRPMISSTRENCLGGACPRHSACHVNRARSEAQRADWVVINHHLFFADQLLQESGVATLLPQAEVLVFDEAHQLNDTGIPFLGQTLGSGQLRELARDLAAQGPAWARGQRPWAHLALGLEQAARAVAGVPRQPGAAGMRSRWQGAAPEGVDTVAWSSAVADVAQALSACREGLRATAQAAIELERLLQRVHAQLVLWGGIVGAPGIAADAVRWMEWGEGGRHWRVVSAPADSSALFRSLLGDAASAGRSWVFSSATLGSDGTLDWFTRGLGLDALPQLRTLRVPSPFDHAAQAALYVPHELPEPGDVAHSPALADAVARWASRLGGRTLVLTTTLRAAARMAEHLQTLVAQGRCAPLQVLAQGRLSKRALLARFRATEQASVLIASAAFWEGVDLAGDVLQLLVIDKLPFPPPDDPLMQARGQRLQALGLSAFNDVFLPEAAMALKQGAGRLIRSETDRGVLVIGDRRLLTRSYGQRLLAALPDMRRLVDEADMASALDALVLTRASTRDR